MAKTYSYKKEPALKYDETVIPFDMEAEKAVCGSLLIDGEIMSDVVHIVTSDDYFTEQNREVYKSCLVLYNQGIAINQITVARELATRQMLEKIGGIAYLSHLVAEVPTSTHIVYYAKIVKSLAVRRHIITMAFEIKKLGYLEGDIEKIVAAVDEKTLDIKKEVALPRLLSPQDVANQSADYYKDLSAGKRIGVYTGIYELDKATGGVFGGEYIIFAGRPGDGKTDLMLSMAEFAGKNFGNVLIVSIEQHWREIIDRVQSRELEISPRRIRLGNYPPELFANIINTLAKVSESNMYFYDSGGSSDGSNIASITAIASHMKRSKGLRAVYLDYLQLVRDNETVENTRERVTNVSMKIKNMARSLDIPVFVTCQMNRDVEKRVGNRPQLADLRESGAIEQDADGVWYLWRADKYAERADDPTQVKENEPQILIAKWRPDGSITDCSIKLRWDKNKHQYYGKVEGDVMDTPEQFK